MIRIFVLGQTLSLPSSALHNPFFVLEIWVFNVVDIDARWSMWLCRGMINSWGFKRRSIKKKEITLEKAIWIHSTINSKPLDNIIIRADPKFDCRTLPRDCLVLVQASVLSERVVSSPRPSDALLWFSIFCKKIQKIKFEIGINFIDYYFFYLFQCFQTVFVANSMKISYIRNITLTYF